MSQIKAEDFLQVEAVPQAAIDRVTELLKAGDIFRYGSKGAEDSEVARLELEFSQHMGRQYALALNSCSSAILVALLSCGTKPGDKILMPAFTFTAVPSAIIHAGATPVLVECDKNFRVDLDDLKQKLTPDITIFLLSHMRGHTSDMDAIVELCHARGVTLIEDAAHSLGTKWKNKLVGSFGKAACYSFQANKIINAGEGGLLVSDDPELIARAIIYSGAYEKLHAKHFISADGSFTKYQNTLPLFNMRMTNITAAIIRPQLAEIGKKGEVFRANYAYLSAKLKRCKHIELPEQDPRELRIPDSIQFRVVDFSSSQMSLFVKLIGGSKPPLPISAFGVDNNNARSFWNWHYLSDQQALTKTRVALQSVCDMRLPVSLTRTHLDYIAHTVVSAVNTVLGDPSA